MQQKSQKLPINNIIYQGENGEILLREDKKLETIWANQSEIAEIFNIDRTVVTRHIGNIFKNNELDKKVVCADFAHTTSHGAIKGKTQSKTVKYYNLDIILSVGYRSNSSKAIAFRKWANSILKSYITDGIAINTSLLQKNTQNFKQALSYLQSLEPNTLSTLQNSEILSLIENYSQTWLSLDNFDKQNFPTDQANSQQISISGDELTRDLDALKIELINKGEATELFAQEKSLGNLKGIFGNVFQSFGGQDLYHSIEQKAAHLLYFIVKNHPFTDGNKRSGAFSFVWFLQKSEYPKRSKISPETLTTLTLLIAQSDPKEKEKMIGLILLILQ